MKLLGAICGLVILTLSLSLSPPTPAQSSSAVQSASPLPSATSAPQQPAFDPSAWRSDLTAWRAKHEQEISAPDGWLSLAGLEWLKSGINSVGSAPDCQIRLRAGLPEHIGLITVSGKIAQLLSPSGGFPSGLTLDGAPAREGPLTTSGAQPSTIAWQGLSLAVLDRGGRFALRIKDSDSAARRDFKGAHWYDPDPRYRVVAQWMPLSPPVVEKIPTILGTTLDMPSPGIATFTLDGKPWALQPVIEGGNTGQLFFILSDQTGQTVTYASGRYLRTGLPSHGLDQPGELVLDFNELFNPPCAYTSYATCPLPPNQNRLLTPIPAGEQRYMR